ncbi:MAG: hypothetical protein HYX75_04395 [Acidobacteria bacterium]|nr:hypothetical protein [Acidobacteriota bacterium]
MANAAIITAKVTKENKPVSGVSVFFWVQDGPHKKNPTRTVKTGADGTARYTIPGDGLLGIDFVYALASLNAPTSGRESFVIARPETQVYTDADWHMPTVEEIELHAQIRCAGIALQEEAARAFPLSPPDARGSLAAMRHFRDTVLMRSDRGRADVHRYYADSPEVVGLVFRHPSLLPRLTGLMLRLAPRLRGIDESGEATFAEKELGEIDQLLSELSGLGSPQLLADLEAVRTDLRDDALRRERHIAIGNATESAHVAATSAAASAGPSTADYDGGTIRLSGNATRNFKLPNGVLLTGSAHDDSGNPAVGAPVAATTQDGYQVGRGLTDSTGSFQIALRPGTYSLFVHPPEVLNPNPYSYPRLVRTKVDAVNVTGDTNIGDVQLGNGYVVTGDVKPASSDLHSLVGSLIAIPSGSTDGPPILAQFQYAQPYGPWLNTYMMALPGGSYSLTFFGGQAYSRPSTQWLPLPAASFATSSLTVSKDLSKDIKLARGYKLSGTAADAQRRALDGLLVIIPQGGKPSRDGKASFTVVMNGTFVTYLATGAYDATFFPLMPPTYTGKAARTSRPVTMSAASQTLVITATDGAVLSGKVTDAAGKAAAATTVWLQPISSGNSPAGLSLPLLALTDAKGQYRLTAPAGSYRLRAAPFGLTAPSVPASIANALFQPRSH